MQPVAHGHCAELEHTRSERSHLPRQVFQNRCHEFGMIPQCRLEDMPRHSRYGARLDGLDGGRTGLAVDCRKLTEYCAGCNLAKADLVASGRINVDAGTAREKEQHIQFAIVEMTDDRLAGLECLAITECGQPAERTFV